MTSPSSMATRMRIFAPARRTPGTSECSRWRVYLSPRSHHNPPVPMSAAPCGRRERSDSDPDV